MRARGIGVESRVARRGELIGGVSGSSEEDW